MSNALYTVYKNRMLGTGSLSLADWDSDTIKAALCTAAYTPSLISDAVFTDLTGVAATATLSGLSISGGTIFCSSTTTFTAVAAGPDVTQIALYKDTGTTSTSPLLVYCDDFDSGMPVTPDGTDIVVTWNASGIVSIA